ncbi:MAG: tryptophan synthase subunit alpha [Candidatus Bathyarchaeia archaeon]
MSAIEETLRRLGKDGEGALIAYVSGGDPDPRYTSEIVGSLISGGADVVELGIPFSDPIADGPTIQAASVRALRAGITPARVMEIAGMVKEEHSSTPLVILSYYNPIFRMGLERFFKLAGDYDIDGVIVPDLPVEEAEEYKQNASNHGIDTIFLATPNTTPERLEKIIDHTSGFLYLVSIFGVTGARGRLHELTLKTMRRLLPRIRNRVPLAVGFGISEPEHVRAIISNGADAAIVGSAFVRIIEKHQDNIEEMTRALKEKAYTLKAETKRVTL